MEKLLRCALCKYEGLQDIKKEMKRTVAGYTFETEVYGQACPSCAEEFYHLESIGKFEEHIARWLAEQGIASGEAFKFMRKFLGFQAIELAQLLDLTAETISRWEQGHRPPEKRAISLLASMVLDKMEGHARTKEHLHSLQQPPPNTKHVHLTQFSSPYSTS